MPYLAFTYLLSRRFHEFLGQQGVYTRKTGLDRKTNKALLLKHIRDNESNGSPLFELKQVLPALSEDQIKKIIQELKEESLIQLSGRNKGARWFPTPQV